MNNIVKIGVNLSNFFHFLEIKTFVLFNDHIEFS